MSSNIIQETTLKTALEVYKCIPRYKATAMDQQQQVLGIISIGDVSSGKSAIIKRYCEPTRFVSRYIPTIGIDYGVVKTASKKMNAGSLADIKVDSFDLSGDSAYSEVRNEFYNNIDGVMLVFDVTSRQSFESLDSWLKELRKYGVSTENTTLVLVGNKADKYPREVKEQEATSFAIERNLTYFETSAKTGSGVDDTIDFLLQDAIKRGFSNE